MTDDRDPDLIDYEIREALAQALRERKVRLTDRRLLILYGMLVFVLIMGGLLFQRSNADRHRFEHAVITNCTQNRTNTIAFDHFIDKLVQSYATSPVLTPKQRRERAAFFAEVRQEVPTCPPKR